MLEEPFLGSDSDDFKPSDRELSSSESYESSVEELKSRKLAKLKQSRANKTSISTYIQTDVPDEIKPSSLGNKDVKEQEIGQKRKQKIFPSKEHVSRKRKCDPDTWKKRKAAIERSTGQAYLSYKNTLVPKKQIETGMLCREKCRLNCSNRFTAEDRTVLLEQFYKLDINSKNSLLFASIIKKPVGRERKGAIKHKSASYKYNVTINGNTETVCKEALCALYQIGRKKIDVIKNHINSGCSAPPPDRRGKHTTRPHKLDAEVEQYIIEHINKFPVEESHYSRNRNPHKKYLSPLLNQKKMYQLYIDECVREDLPLKFKIKQKTYSKIFVSKFNLSFGNPRSDTCSTCDAGGSNEEHKENYLAGFQALKHDRERVKHSSNMVYVTIDMQQTMPLPKVTTSKAFYLRQMWFYNFGIHTITKTIEKASFCTWTEDIANRGSAETCSSLLRYIEVDESIKDKNHLIIWSDSCAGQNKNFHMICLYQYLLLKGYFRCIDHKFPEVGHTYLDSDRDFGRIEKVLRRNDTVYVPDKYREIILKASRKNQVIDMAQHFRKISDLPDKLRLINRKKDELQETVRFRDGIKWIRVEEYGSYLYKESYHETVPFKKVNILKNKKISDPPNDIEIERIREKYGTISNEKKANLRDLIKFVKEEYRYFYEPILED